jgi:prepilin-type processing-associated H-X9-DG protein
VLAPILGVVAIRRIKKSNGKLKGTALAVGGITFHLILAAVVTYGFFAVRTASFRMFCRTQLSGLGKALSSYAQRHNGRYPSPSNWCDLLIKDELAGEIQFFCKEAVIRGDVQRCNYAMNPECEPNSPGDTVLLFETKGGWNQCGGPEILTTGNHGGKGCNILFNDGRVRFVKQEELGRLKWKVEEANGVE